jgi:sugar (glycoside-pentoside-hexuronide) transporter
MPDTTRVPNRKLGFLTKLGYGAAGFSASMFYNNFSFYAMVFFTDYVRLDVLVATMIVTIGAVWDALSNPIIGYLSDKSRLRWGRRRPFMVMACVPLALFTWLSFTDLGLSQAGTIVFFLVVVLGGYLMQAMVDIPYSALGAEMTESYSEHSSLAAYRNMFWLVSMIISSSLLAIADVCSGTFAGGDVKAGISLAALLCALLSLILLVVSIVATRGRDSYATEERAPRFSFRRQIVETLRVKPFRFIVVVYLLSIMAQIANNTFIVYFMKYSCRLDDFTISAFLVYSCLVGLIGNPLANIIGKRSKKLAWGLMMACWVLGMVLTFFLWDSQASLPVLAVIGLAIGIGLTVQYQLIWSMISDCVDVAEFESGVRHEAVFFSTAAMIQKLGAAVTMLALGAVLQVIGYDGSLGVQPQGVADALKYLFVACVSIPLFVSIIVAAFDPITRRAHASLVEALKAKRQGKPYSTEGFKGLLK